VSLWDDWGDPHDLVKCPTCRGAKLLVNERRDGTLVRRTCRTCGGRGQVLQGNPPDSPYEITFDYRAGAHECSGTA
jgi:hypothetical protein